MELEAADGSGEMSERCLALLGRRDEPTDAVEEYSKYLSEALRAHGFAMELERVAWAERGWGAALAELRARAGEWRGEWIFVQYTVLAWSRRGFPWRFLRVLRDLRRAGARVAVVYHDSEPFSGERIVDFARRATQMRVMRGALRYAELAVFTAPMEKISWLAGTEENAREKCVFIPVGANFSDGVAGECRAGAALALTEGRKRLGVQSERKTVAVFGITGREAGKKEFAAIVEAMRFAAKRIGAMRLSVFGRNAESVRESLPAALRDVPVAAEVRGVISAEEVARELAAADVLLFVRGPISSRRGSAIAGIACGIAVIAYAGAQTAAPITEAGVALIESKKREELGEALVRVLSDDVYRAGLMERSRAAHEKYFSWAAIAAKYMEAMRRRNLQVG